MASLTNPGGTVLSVHYCFVFLPLCSHCWISWWSHARKLCELAADAGIRQCRGSLSPENGSTEDPTSATRFLPSRVLFLQFPLSSSPVSLAAATNTQGLWLETTQVCYLTVLGVRSQHRAHWQKLTVWTGLQSWGSGISASSRLPAVLVSLSCIVRASDAMHCPLKCGHISIWP